MTGRRISVVTGTRAEFGLLRPVMAAIDAHPGLTLDVLVTGTHLLPPARTIDEVRAAFAISAAIEMQRFDRTGRLADAAALGRGIEAFARHFEGAPADVVLVLGDRIEAFAAAASAAIGGMRVAHVHGGDRAEGIADESMRHAISKLAHLHFAASRGSAARLVTMGEDPDRVHFVGSPAIDGVADLAPLDDAAYDELGRPEIVFLLHPLGRDDALEQREAAVVLRACREAGRVLALHPNHDPGRSGIVRALGADETIVVREHLDRATFLRLLRRARVLVGNSSAGLIEAAALPTWCIDVGPRQGGREKPENVKPCRNVDPAAIASALQHAMAHSVPTFHHPYGAGDAGPRIAEVLATFDSDKYPLTKRNTF